MKTPELIPAILDSEDQTVRSYCAQIVAKRTQIDKLICDHILKFLLPACAQFDQKLQTMGSKDQANAINYLNEVLKHFNEHGDYDAKLMINAVLDRAWELQKKKYSWRARIELGAIILAAPTFLFKDSNTTLNMNLAGRFGGQTHRDFTRALGLAAMAIAAEQQVN